MLRRLGTLFNLGAIGELSDGQLLERFATRGGEEGELAFSALVERHGPMVWRVCRAGLRDSNDAEDAFQATFLVLVSKAKSLWVRDSLGPWLHRVAHRVASRARRDAFRRLEHERRAAEARSTTISHEPDDLAAMLHEEIERLPARCREPLILCDLQGLTHHEAARRLGCPLGTLKTRIARAREILRGRLSRRNGLPSGLLIAEARLATTLRGAPSVPPASLFETTIQTAAAVATGEAVALKVIPAPVAALFKEATDAMFLTKLKIAAAALFLAASSIGVAVALAQSGEGEKPKQVEAAGRLAAPATLPEYIEKSELWRPGLILKRLGEEAFANQLRLGRLVKTLRDKGVDEAKLLDDPAVIAANETIDDQMRRLDLIDRILRDALNAYPTLRDFSGDPTRSDLQVLDELGRRDPELEQRRARKRYRWAQRMNEKGYLSRSKVEAELENSNRAYWRTQSAKANGQPESGSSATSNDKP